MNKQLLITGATSGIGFEFIKARNTNYKVIHAFGRSFQSLDALSINGLVKYNIDFSNEYRTFDLSQITGKIDNIVICAGFVKNNVLKFHDSNHLVDTINVNLISQLNLIGQLVKENKLARSASVVIVSSLLGPHVGILGTMAYAASKSALVGACKVLALELARSGVRVNTISPGMVETPLVENLSVGQTLIDADMQRYPLGKRYARTSEIVNAIDFLLSDNASFITGEDLKIDGGYTLY